MIILKDQKIHLTVLKRPCKGRELQFAYLGADGEQIPALDYATEDTHATIRLPDHIDKDSIACGDKYPIYCDIYYDPSSRKIFFDRAKVKSPLQDAYEQHISMLVDNPVYQSDEALFSEGKLKEWITAFRDKDDCTAYLIFGERAVDQFCINRVFGPEINSSFQEIHFANPSVLEAYLDGMNEGADMRRIMRISQKDALSIVASINVNTAKAKP